MSHKKEAVFGKGSESRMKAVYNVGKGLRLG